jgi:heme/copper-type cytochrome/quinol oxidase subunit 2
MLTSDFNFKIEKDYLRLLRATNSLILPSKSIIRLLASSDDVTHSWAIPGVGLKVDCVPGRLFSVFTIIDRDGVYFGQCSELCG